MGGFVIEHKSLQLLAVLMSNHTIAHTPTIETLFSIVYETKAVLPIEREVKTYKVTKYNVKSNEEI